MPRQARLTFTFALAFLLAAVLALAAGHNAGQRATADISGVTANLPSFAPGQPLTITVSAEDDDGVLTIISNLQSSTLTVTNCSGVGSNQVAGKCDGSGFAAVTGQGTTHIAINSDLIDSDDSQEPFTVTLTLTATCSVPTAVTIAANQPGNVGPDNVTVNCIPPTPTPTPTLTPTPTPTPTATPTLTPTPGALSIQVSVNPTNLTCQGSALVTVSARQGGNAIADGTQVSLTLTFGTLQATSGVTTGGNFTTLLSVPSSNQAVSGAVTATASGVGASAQFGGAGCAADTLAQPPSPPQIRPPNTGGAGLR